MLFLDDLKDRNQACSVRFPCKIGLKTQLCGCYRHSASTLCYKPPKQQNLWVNRRKIQADDLQPKKAQIFTAEDKAWNLRWKENDWTSRGRRCFKKGCRFMFKCGFFFFTLWMFELQQHRAGCREEVLLQRELKIQIY